MKPILSARTRFKSAVEIFATSCLSSQISPALGRSRQPIRFMRVLLPDPEGPMTASHSPGSTERDTSSSACTTPLNSSAWAGYSLLTFFSLINSHPPQDVSRLHTPQQSNGQNRGDEGHHHAGRQYEG